MHSVLLPAVHMIQPSFNANKIEQQELLWSLCSNPPEEVNTGGAVQQSATQHQQCDIPDTHTVEKLTLKMLEK